MRPKPNATPGDLALGVNACDIALEEGPVRSLLYFAETRNERVLALAEKARERGVSVQQADGWRLDELTGGGVHQGVLVRLRDLESADLGAIARRAPNAASLVLLLDSVTDP